MCGKPGSDGKETGELTVYGRGANYTGISVCRSRVLAARGPGVEHVSQTKVVLVIHSK